MICIYILLIYCLIGIGFWCNTRSIWERQTRKHWLTMSILIWPILMWHYFKGY